MIKCPKCWLLKMTDKSKCLCNAKPFNEKKFEKQKEKKPIAQVSEKKQERIKDNWSELQFFKAKYKKLVKNNENICDICKIKVDEEDVTPSCFPHILPKWKYPEYRYFDNNIWFVCWIDCHHRFDEAINNYKEINWLFELEKQIKNWKYIDIKDYIW